MTDLIAGGITSIRCCRIACWLSMSFCMPFRDMCTAASFFCCAVADVLLFVYLKRYKRICERALYEARKKVMGR